MQSDEFFLLEEAKKQLDLIFNKSRVDMYKPIQIAEVLYHSRTQSTLDLDLGQLETFRKVSKHWRNEVSSRLLGKNSASSAKYQDDVWSESAMPPRLLLALDKENKATDGAVEKYIYLRFQEKQSTVAAIMALVEEANPQSFQISQLFSYFQKLEVRRSVDKVYEVVVYALLETFIIALQAKVTVSIAVEAKELLNDFSELGYVLLGLLPGQIANTNTAHVYRAGVTNQADRGLDM